MSTVPRATTVAGLSLAVAMVAGCSNTDAEPTNGSEAADDSAHGEDVTVAEPWIKAATVDDGMTALFGDLSNDGSEPVRVVAASTEAADVVELHEVTEGDDGNASMQEKENGFPVDAGEEHPLEPGADHVMLMELSEDLEPGMEITVVLEFEDGSTTEVTAPVKDYEGGNEEYDDSDHEDHGGDDDHDDHDDDEQGDDDDENHD